MLDGTSFILTSIFGLFGLAYFVYGKRQTEFAFMCSGALLMIFPFFVSGTILVALVGVILTAAPFAAQYLE